MGTSGCSCRSQHSTSTGLSRTPELSSPVAPSQCFGSKGAHQVLPGWKPWVRASPVVGRLRLSEMTWRTQGLPWTLVLGMVRCDSQVGTARAEMFPREGDLQALCLLDECDGHSCLTCRVKPKKLLLWRRNVTEWHCRVLEQGLSENAEVWLNNTEEKQQSSCCRGQLDLMGQTSCQRNRHLRPLAAHTGGEGALGWTWTMPVHLEREKGGMLLHKAPWAPRCCFYTTSFQKYSPAGAPLPKTINTCPSSDWGLEGAALQEGKGQEPGERGQGAAPGAQIPNRRNSCFASNSITGSEADFMTYLFILSLMNRRLI